MARTSRIVLNYRKLAEINAAFVDGVFEVGKAIIENANPPDASPYGVGLVTQGGVIVWHDTKMVKAWSLSGQKPKKPKKFRVGAERGNIVGVAGFDHPGRFQEFGTVHHRAQPFLTPALNETDGKAVLDRVVRPRLR